MNIQIIYCHPSENSYTNEVLEKLKTQLTKENLQYEISDLYSMNFSSDMTEQEYNREGFANFDLPLPPEVKVEQQKLEKADCVIFLYPVWWSDCPAKLKGWFDRVFTVGYAYGNSNDSTTKKMKTIPIGIVLCTAGHPNGFLDEIGIAESMRNVMLDDRLGNRFKNKEMIILGGTLDKEKARSVHDKIIASLGSKIKAYLN